MFSVYYNLVEQFNEIAFIFNGSIANMSPDSHVSHIKIEMVKRLCLRNVFEECLIFNGLYTKPSFGWSG